MGILLARHAMPAFLVLAGIAGAGSLLSLRIRPSS
jgi:hypothetical protein